MKSFFKKHWLDVLFVALIVSIALGAAIVIRKQIENVAHRADVTNEKEVVIRFIVPEAEVGLSEHVAENDLVYDIQNNAVIGSVLSVTTKNSSVLTENSVTGTFGYEPLADKISMDISISAKCKQNAGSFMFGTQNVHVGEKISLHVRDAVFDAEVTEMIREEVDTPISYQDSSVSSDSNAEITLRCRQTTKAVRDAFVVGDTVYLSDTQKPVGIVTRIESVPAKSELKKNNGEKVIAEIPDCFVTDIVIAVSGELRENGFYTKDQTAFLYGSKHTIQTLTAKTQVQVTDVTMH